MGRLHAASKASNTRRTRAKAQLLPTAPVETCPNPGCARTFASPRALGAHLYRSPLCVGVARRIAANASRPLRSSAKLPASGGQNSKESSVPASESASVVEGIETSSDLDMPDNDLAVDSDDDPDAWDDQLDMVELDEGDNTAMTINNGAFKFGIMFTDTQYVETSLLQILNDANTPHFLYQQVMNWAKEARSLNYDFTPRAANRKSHIHRFRKWLHMEYINPEQTIITIPYTKHEISITHFNFVNMLFSILEDPALMGDLSKLDVNPVDPYAKYANTDGRLTCFNAG